MFEYSPDLRENTMTMVERQKTLIEELGNDQAAFEDAVRYAASLDIYSNAKEVNRVISRATNPQFLTKDAEPKPEDIGVFISALLQRYIEAADTLGGERGKQRQVMLAQTALATDVLRGIDDWDELALRYREHVPAIKKEGAYIGWLRMVSESARMIREDLGIQPPERKKRTQKVTGEEAFSTMRSDLTPGSENLRSTIIDLISDENAPGMTKDLAAALLVALGIEKPRQGISSEKLETYKTHAMQWLGRRLSHINHSSHEDDDVRLKLERGRQDLAEVAKKYPSKGDMTAPEWIVWRATGKTDRDYIRYVESNMALALQELLVEKSD